MNPRNARLLVSHEKAEQTIRDLSRRGFLVSVVGGGAALALAACSTDGGSGAGSGKLDGSRIEKSMVLGNYSDYVNPADLKSFAKAKGPSVSIQLYSSGQEMVSKLNGGGAKYDVVVGGPTEVNQLRELGLVRKLDKSLIPNLKNVLPSVMDNEWDPGAQYAVPKSVGVVSFYWLPGVTGAAEARSIGDMFEVVKRNKGKNIAYFNSAKESFTIALAAIGKPINSENQADIDAATAALIAIKPCITVYSDDQLSALQARQIDLGLGYNGAAYQANQTAASTSYDFMLPSSGTTEYFIDNWMIPVSGQNPVAAHAFIDYMCDPKIAASETNTNYYTAPIDGITPYLDPKIADVPYLNPTDEDLGRYTALVATPKYLNLVAKAYAKFKAA